jgi:hypothetical protein
MISDHHPSEDVSVLLVRLGNQQGPVAFPDLPYGSVEVGLPIVEMGAVLLGQHEAIFAAGVLVLVGDGEAGEVVEVVTFFECKAGSDGGGEVVDLAADLEGLTFIAILHNDY